MNVWGKNFVPLQSWKKTPRFWWNSSFHMHDSRVSLQYNWIYDMLEKLLAAKRYMPTHFILGHSV